MSKLYICVLDEFPDYMTPTLVAHSVLGYHMINFGNPEYDSYLNVSFKKVVVRVSQKEFDKISKLDRVYLGHENSTLEGRKSCAVWLYNEEELPNVIKFAKLWKPKE